MTVTDRQTDRQTYRQTDRQVTQTNRQTGRDKDTFFSLPCTVNVPVCPEYFPNPAVAHYCNSAEGTRMLWEED